MGIAAKIGGGGADGSYEELMIPGQGFISESFSRMLTSSGAVAATQSLLATALPLRVGTQITNVHVVVTTAAAGTVPTLIKCALLSSTGKVLGQSSNLASDSMWTSGVGIKTIPLVASAVIPADGLYYVAFLQNGAFTVTPLQLLRVVTAVAAALAPVGSGVSPAASQAAQTDFAATGSSQTLVNASNPFWVGAS